MSYLIETILPPLHSNWDIKDLVGADNLLDVQQKVIQYLNDLDVVKNGNNLYIYSVENGTGKTRIAYFILYMLHQPRLGLDGQPMVVPVASITFGEYLKFCQDGFSEDGKAARKFVMKAPILLLDDVSAAFGSGSLHTDKRELLLLMKYRREHKLITIVTSNLTPTAFDKLYGPTASSKALENFSYIEVIGGDVRQDFYPDQFETATNEEDEEACR